MAFTLKRECAVVLIYNGKGYRFDALTQFDFGQTYNKTSNSRKTLHSRRANQISFANSKSAASFSCTVLCTDSFSEGVLFELVGLTKLAPHVYKYEDTLTMEPNTCEIYVVSNYYIYKLTKASIESLEVPMSKLDPLAISVSFTASNLELVDDIGLSSGLIPQGEPLLPTPIQYQHNNIPNKHIRTAGLSIQQDIDWRNDRSLHDINKIHVPTRSILTGRSLGINTTSYLNSNIKFSDKPEYANVEVYKSGMSIGLTNALVTSRVSPDDIFSHGNDITVTNKTRTAIVEYGGYLV